MLKALRAGVAGISKCPVADDFVQAVQNSLRHGFQFGNKLFLREFAPSVKRDIGLIGVLNDTIGTPSFVCRRFRKSSTDVVFSTLSHWIVTIISLFSCQKPSKNQKSAVPLIASMRALRKT